MTDQHIRPGEEVRPGEQIFGGRAVTRRPRGASRSLGTGLLLAGVLVLAGCGTTSTQPGAEDTATTRTTTDTTSPTSSPTAPSEVPTEDVITGGEGTSTEAEEAVLQLDGATIATGSARCARAIDESTDQPTIRLMLESADKEHNAEVVVTDTDDPQVVSAVVMQGDEGALAGAEGLDGSTLQAARDGNTFTVSGSVKDPVEGSTHELSVRTTCTGL